METKSKGRTSEALTKLIDLQPPKARRFKKGRLEQTEVHLLQINDLIQVRHNAIFKISVKLYNLLTLL